jgi:hypothetical protein
MFLKVGFILVKVHNPHEYVDIDIYMPSSMRCFGLLVDILNIILVYL